MTQPSRPSRNPPDFDAMYAADADPWRVGSSWYERRKLAVLMASLPLEHYASAWEPGCGPGFTSVALSSRVDALVASDSSKVAIEEARRRCRQLRHVQCLQSALPDVPLAGPVELVLVAEFLYYVPDLGPALDALWSSVERGGHLVAMHWAHHPHDTLVSGPEMQTRLARAARDRGAAKLVTHVDQDFLLDIYEAVA